MFAGSLRAARKCCPVASRGKARQSRALGFAQTFRFIRSSAYPDQYIVQSFRGTAGGEPARCNPKLLLLGHRRFDDQQLSSLQNPFSESAPRSRVLCREGFHVEILPFASL